MNRVIYYLIQLYYVIWTNHALVFLNMKTTFLQINSLVIEQSDILYWINFYSNNFSSIFWSSRAYIVDYITNTVFRQFYARLFVISFE